MTHANFLIERRELTGKEAASNKSHYYEATPTKPNQVCGDLTFT